MPLGLERRLEIERLLRPGVGLAAGLALVVETAEHVDVLHVPERVDPALGLGHPPLRHVDVRQHLSRERPGEGIGPRLRGDAGEGRVHRTRVGEVVAKTAEPDERGGAANRAGLGERLLRPGLGLGGKRILSDGWRGGCGEEGRKEEAGNHGSGRHNPKTTGVRFPDRPGQGEDVHPPRSRLTQGGAGRPDGGPGGEHVVHQHHRTGGHRPARGECAVHVLGALRLGEAHLPPGSTDAEQGGLLLETGLPGEGAGEQTRLVVAPPEQAPAV